MEGLTLSPRQLLTSSSSALEPRQHLDWPRLRSCSWPQPCPGSYLYSLIVCFALPASSGWRLKAAICRPCCWHLRSSRLSARGNGSRSDHRHCFHVSINCPPLSLHSSHSLQLRLASTSQPSQLVARGAGSSHHRPFPAAACVGLLSCSPASAMLALRNSAVACALAVWNHAPRGSCGNARIRSLVRRSRSRCTKTSQGGSSRFAKLSVS